MGGAVFPSCCLTWVQTMVEVVKIMATSFKRSSAPTVVLSGPYPAAGHCRPTPLPETPGHSGQVWVGLLSGHCSFLLGPGLHKVLFVPSRSLFPQSYVSTEDSMVELMVTSSKRAYAIPRSAAPRAPALLAGRCWPILLQEILKHPKAGLAQSLWGLWVLLRAYFVSKNFISILQLWTHIIFTVILWCRYYNYPHFYRWGTGQTRFKKTQTCS